MASSISATRLRLLSSVIQRHQKQHFRQIQQKPKSFINAYRNFFNKKKAADTPDTLYQHVVQIGDPALREKSLPIDPKDIPRPEIQTIISGLKAMLDKYDGVGMSACQLGIPVRIMAIQLTPKQLKVFPPELIARQGMEPVPLRVLMNPVMRVTDNTSVTHREGCCSVNAHSALVPRHKAVSVTALDQEGKETTWQAKDWAARIVQHEMDHLDGRVFTDIMKRDSFVFNYWNVVNARGGEFKIGYAGISGVKHKLLPFNVFGKV